MKLSLDIIYKKVTNTTFEKMLKKIGFDNI